jgi:hypothetical protein
MRHDADAPTHAPRQDDATEANPKAERRHGDDARQDAAAAEQHTDQTTQRSKQDTDTARTPTTTGNTAEQNTARNQETRTQKPTATRRPTMTQEQKQATERTRTERKIAQYRIRRAALLLAMGGRCEFCHTDERLEFDHPHGRTWDCHQTSRWTRIKKYEQDHTAGNLRILCRSCNAAYIPTEKTA